MNFTKKNSVIYVLCGKSGNGKTTSANIIEKYYNKKGKKTISLAYASYLKEYAKKILNWDGNEETKPRDFLQQLGVELIKSKIDDRFLIKRIVDDIKIYSYFYDVIIITDARFPDEIDVIKNNFNNVKTIKLIGRYNDELTIEQKKHATETSLDNYDKYDYTVNNDKSLDDLKNKLESIINEVE